MSGYNSIPRYTSPKEAIRNALGRLGYASSYQSMKPDFIAWTADAQDLISRLKTYVDMPYADYVCGNKIMLPQEMGLITCATYGQIDCAGTPMTYKATGNCQRLCKNSVNRCCSSAQFFTLDECYMHFTPALADGMPIFVNGMQRPVDDEGYPLILETSVLAVSEYIAANICLRFSDKRYDVFHNLWLKHCVRARAEANQFSNIQAQNLGYLYHSMPVNVTHSPGWTGANVGGVW